MKKYLLVCWDEFYPNGGLGNIVAHFDSVFECEKYYEKDEENLCYHDYCLIYDRDSLLPVKKIIYKKNEDY